VRMVKVDEILQRRLKFSPLDLYKTKGRDACWSQYMSL